MARSRNPGGGSLSGWAHKEGSLERPPHRSQRLSPPHYFFGGCGGKWIKAALTSLTGSTQAAQITMGKGRTFPG
jgi:hypothetical protein